MTGLIGVAISTTGDEHRMGFLETCLSQWRRVMLGSVIVVTVDGDAAAAERVRQVVSKASPEGYVGGNTYRVGQPRHARVFPGSDRMGVAANKNTGIELLMDAGVKHLFLCDDDTWPLNSQSLTKHLELDEPHSMVCWGAHRLQRAGQHFASWSWPRGVMLYTERHVIESVGGMDERFGPGGHEHVEWSRRIHQAGHTSDLFVSPRVYAEFGVGGRATRASSFWHAEDMRRQGESVAALGMRRKRLTTVRRKPRDWDHINKIMLERDGDTSFVSFRAHENGRASATLCLTSTGQGAGGDL